MSAEVSDASAVFARWIMEPGAFVCSQALRSRVADALFVRAMTLCYDLISNNEILDRQDHPGIFQEAQSHHRHGAKLLARDEA